ncbi:hypothetical protein [Amedibacillus dolichus]|uniref:hypothetical protein n=1 Tax=Amedibacillus dolichus TaxID=31971 RepID=UPI0024314299|nr:hypothetical protein [Amedibacillus dolichus]
MKVIDLIGIIPKTTMITLVNANDRLIYRRNAGDLFVVELPKPCNSNVVTIIEVNENDLKILIELY